MRKISVWVFAFIIGAWLGWGGCDYLFHKNFEIGECYLLKNRDPFKEKDIILVFEQEKDGYMRCHFHGSKYKFSHRLKSVDHLLYKQIPCPGIIK